MANKVIKALDSFNDFVGNTVKVGAHVVYATTSGRSPVQKFAVVDRIDLVEDEYYHRQFVRVGVREIANGRGFARSGSRWNRETCSYDHDTEPSKRVSYPLADNIVLVRTPEEIEVARHPKVIIFSQEEQ